MKQEISAILEYMWSTRGQKIELSRLSNNADLQHNMQNIIQAPAHLFWDRPAILKLISHNSSSEKPRKGTMKIDEISFNTRTKNISFAFSVLKKTWK